jgi:hypothetical protein
MSKCIYDNHHERDKDLTLWRNNWEKHCSHDEDDLPVKDKDLPEVFFGTVAIEQEAILHLHSIYINLLLVC